MRRALFQFYVPAGKALRVGCISAGVTLLLGALGLYAPLVPWLACFAAWKLAKCGAELVVQPLREWQQALPVPRKLLSWTRVVAPWSLGWTGAVAALASISALAWAGALTREQWLGAFSQVACLLGFIPFASGSAQRWARPGSSVTSTGMGLLISGGLIFPLLPFLLGPYAAAGMGVGLGAIGLLIETCLALTEFRELPTAMRTTYVARPATFVTPPALSLAMRLMPRARSLVVPWFFYFRDPARLWQTLPHACLVLLLATDGNDFGVLFWMLLCSSVFSVYLGTLGPSRLPAHWPVSRDRRLCLTFAPLCLVAVGSIGIESYRATQAPARVVGATTTASPSTAIDDEPRARRLLAPSPFWRATLSERPLVPLPNGELVQIPSQRAISGLPLWVYNPFDAWMASEPAVFNARVSELLRDEWHLDVTDADVDDSYARWNGSFAVRQVDCPRQGIAGTCRRPWMWLAVKFWLLALVAWAAARPGLRSSHAPGRWRRYCSHAFAVLCLALMLGPVLAMQRLSSYEPDGFGIFWGAVLLGELVRLCQRAPLLACTTGLGVLVLLYWNLARSYRRAELPL